MRQQKLFLSAHNMCAFFVHFGMLDYRCKKACGRKTVLTTGQACVKTYYNMKESLAERQSELNV